MYVWLAVALAFIASLAVSGLQTWNLRACQRQSAKALAEYAVAIAAQNAKVAEWEQKAKAAQANAAQAGKQAAETVKRAKEKEQIILSQPGPSAEASCEERETSVLDLLRRARTP